MSISSPFASAKPLSANIKTCPLFIQEMFQQINALKIEAM